jgi:hypothetical protein
MTYFNRSIHLVIHSKSFIITGFGVSISDFGVHCLVVGFGVHCLVFGFGVHSLVFGFGVFGSHSLALGNSLSDKVSFGVSQYAQ